AITLALTATLFGHSRASEPFKSARNAFAVRCASSASVGILKGIVPARGYRSQGTGDRGGPKTCPLSPVPLRQDPITKIHRCIAHRLPPQHTEPLLVGGCAVVAEVADLEKEMPGRLVDLRQHL